jgi:hypothetical protein
MATLEQLWNEFTPQVASSASYEQAKLQASHSVQHLTLDVRSPRDFRFVPVKQLAD